MDTTFINELDETTGRYVRQVLHETNTDNQLREELAQVQRQAAEVMQEVEVGASPDDALTFTRELDSFLNKSKAKALEAKSIETEIELKRNDVAETQAEIQRLSASMPALADAVNRTLDRYEDARHDYNAQEFKIATFSTKLSIQRGELTELRQRLAQLKGQEVER